MSVVVDNDPLKRISGLVESPHNLSLLRTALAFNRRWFKAFPRWSKAALSREAVDVDAWLLEDVLKVVSLEDALTNGLLKRAVSLKPTILRELLPPRLWENESLRTACESSPDWAAIHAGQNAFMG